MSSNLNPLKRLRLELNLTQQQVVELAGVSQQLVVRAEQGLFPGPPPAYLNFLCDRNSPVVAIKDYRDFIVDTSIPNQVEVTKKYHQFQKTQRLENYGRLISCRVEEFDDLLPITNPLVYWLEVSHLSPTEFCKLYCIQLSTVHKVLKQPWLINSLPGGLVDALLEGGYDFFLLAAVERAYLRYKAHCASLVTSSNSYGVEK